MNVRITVTDVWDTVTVETSGDASLGAVKEEALRRTVGNHVEVGQYLTKYRGAEVLDEGVSLAGLGVPDDGALVVLRAHRSPTR